MFILKTRSEFDSAHFLKGYEGKCANIHGHRWIVTVEVGSEKLEEQGPSRGMVVDFSKLKEDLKEETSRFDHVLIIEKGSLSDTLLSDMKKEGFMVVELDYRPTAEHFAKYFFDVMSTKGYRVIRTRVFETPENCAEYTERLV